MGKPRLNSEGEICDENTEPCPGMEAVTFVDAITPIIAAPVIVSPDDEDTHDGYEPVLMAGNY